MASALLLAFWPPRAAEGGAFPRPQELEPLVQFWIEIFTVQGSDRTILHDRDDPRVRYETVDTGGMTESVRRKFLRKRRRHYAKLLENLALKRPERWSEEERRVASFFPKGSRTARYLEAAGRIRSQRGIRERFREGLQRSGRWRKAIEEILRSYQIPIELAALPHVESSFNPEARSKAGAVGIWQFTTGTGRKFLRIDYQVDERKDVYVSTHAAARFLKEAHAEVGSWPLAVTAYNHGVNGVLRAQKELGTVDIARLIREYDGPYFGFASKNFYAEFLAALEVAGDPIRHFGSIVLDLPEDVERFVLPSPTRFSSLCKAFTVSEGELRRVNPAIGARVVEGRYGIPSGTVINVPTGRVDDLADAFLSLPESERHVALEPKKYRVRRGDTLIAIARRHRVSVADLQEINGMGRSTLIRTGQRLSIPPSNR